MIDKAIGPYTVIEPLGAGGMGEVYVAEDTRLDRRVALKVLPAAVANDPDRLDLLRREAKAIAALNHPNIVTLYSFEEIGGLHFLTMELVEGESLSRRIPRGGMPVDEFLRLAIRLTDALESAHARGVVHRDLKPANILINERQEPKILDFGLASFVLDDVTVEDDAPTRTLPSEGKAFGTAGYMSPEQVSGGQIDRRSDIFSLGIVFHEMLTGRRPFDGRSFAEVIAAVLRDQPPPLPERVPEALAELVEGCLAKEPAQRIGSAAELHRRLLGLASGSQHGAAAAGTGRRADLEDTRPEPEETTTRAGGSRPAAGTEASRRAPAAAPSAGPAIAVLPFADLSPEGDQDHFCEGMVEEITGTLARVDGLRVVARTSSRQFKDSSIDVREAGRRLNASLILEGSLRKAGRRLRIGVRLIDVESGYDLWSERFDRELEDVFEIHDDIAARTVAELEKQIRAGAAIEMPSLRRRPQNLDAYRLYLRGRHHWGARTEETIRESIALFQRAIEADPDYAKAYAGLADAYVTLGIYGFLPTAEVMPEAGDAVRRALELEPRSPEALTSLGAVQALFDWNWSEAEACMRAAIEIDPDYTTAHHWYAANVLTPLGRFEEASAEARRAVELDPLSATARVGIGVAAYYARRHEEAITEIDTALELDADLAVAHLFRGQALAETGRFKDALDAARRAEAASGGSVEAVAARGHVHALAGDHAAAREVLARLDEIAATGRYVSASRRAQIYAALDEPVTAIGLLERAHRERAVDIAWLAVRPVFDPLRGEPRFEALLEAMSLPRAGPLAEQDDREPA